MIITLKKNERLVFAGYATLRAPDGTISEKVPQYTIEPKGDIDKSQTYFLYEGERLIVAGSVCTVRAAAEERYAAALRGEKIEPQADSAELYIKVDKEAVDSLTGLIESEKKSFDDFAHAVAPLFKQYNE